MKQLEGKAKAQRAREESEAKAAYHRTKELEIESRRLQLQQSTEADMASKKAMFLKETARHDKLMETRDFLKPYAAAVSASSVDAARYVAGVCAPPVPPLSCGACGRDSRFASVLQDAVGRRRPCRVFVDQERPPPVSARKRVFRQRAQAGVCASLGCHVVGGEVGVVTTWRLVVPRG